MVDDVLLNKVAIIERCLARAAYVGHEAAFETDFTRQDSIILNLQRACGAAIDLAMHVVRTHRLGLPQDARDAFTLLGKAGRLSQGTADRMRAMVGFRDIAVHQYQSLSIPIVRSILDNRLDDFTTLTTGLVKQERTSS